MTRSAPPSVFAPYSQERALDVGPGDVVFCARCESRGTKTALVFKADALGRVRSRCPHCDRVAPARPPHPDEVLVPSHLVRERDLLPVCPPDTLRCQRCAHPVEGRDRFCAGCLRLRVEAERDAQRKTNFTYKAKYCAWPGCAALFQPSGPRSKYCEVHA